MSELGLDPRWLPPSPHREAMLACLGDGGAQGLFLGVPVEVFSRERPWRDGARIW